MTPNALPTVIDLGKRSQSSFGPALVARSWSLVSRPKRKSRTLPPTTYAIKPASSKTSIACFTYVGRGNGRSIRIHFVVLTVAAFVLAFDDGVAFEAVGCLRAFCFFFTN